MIRSMSYSRYFRIATPMDTGSAANPNQARLVTTCQAPAGNAEWELVRKALATTTTAPLASHFSCWRRSPEDRRQLRTWRPMKATMNSRMMSCSGFATAPYQPDASSVIFSPPLTSTWKGRPMTACAVATARMTMLNT